MGFAFGCGRAMLFAVIYYLAQSPCEQYENKEQVKHIYFLNLWPYFHTNPAQSRPNITIITIPVVVLIRKKPGLCAFRCHKCNGLFGKTKTRLPQAGRRGVQ